MTLTFAYECFADEDIWVFLRDHCGLPLRKRHSYGQGEVINDLLRRTRADIGMVDEDPGSSHHPLRDAMQVELTTDDLEVRRRSGRHLIVLKPELEECFIRSMNRVALPLTLGANPKALQKLLNVPNHPSHREFREQLQVLHEKGVGSKVPTFITDVERVIRGLL